MKTKTPCNVVISGMVVVEVFQYKSEFAAIPTNVEKLVPPMWYERRERVICLGAVDGSTNQAFLFAWFINQN